MRIRTGDVLVWLAFVLLVVLLFSSITFAGPQECKSSVCRTSTVNAVGSGVCYGRAANGDVLVLTARHCVRNFRVTCEFFLGTEYAVAAKGRVVAVSSNRDLAAIRIPAEQFRGRFPASVPVADMPPEIGERIHTIGCSRGRNPTALAGSVLDYPTPRDMAFSPAPANGRSGSAVFDSEGDSIVGILTNRRRVSGSPVHGLAESTEAISGFFGPSESQAAEAVPGETEEAFWRILRRRRGCGPGGCNPDGGGDPGGDIGGYAPAPEWEGPGLPELPLPPEPPEPVVPVEPVEPVEPSCEEELNVLRVQVSDLTAEVDGLKRQITNITVTLTDEDIEFITQAVLNALPKPQEPNQVSHYVLVSTQSGDYWTDMRRLYYEAKEHYQIDHAIPIGNVGPLPAIVAYRSGSPVWQATGVLPVTRALEAIRSDNSPISE